MTLTKKYDNVLYKELDLNTQAIYKYLVSDHQLLPEVKEHLETLNDFEAAYDYLDTVEATEDVTRLQVKLQPLTTQDLSAHFYDEYLSSSLPKFLYFDEYYQLNGVENIEQLIARKNSNTTRPSDLPMLGLIEQARLDLKQLLNPSRTQELRNKLEGASNHISRQILKYWSQNKHLMIEFDVRPGRPGDPEGKQQGNNIWAIIRDQKRMVTTNLGARSKGFVWFFSFLAWYIKTAKEHKNIILLLDEPGLSLHAKAQNDLLRYFEEGLKPQHQVIYTTHSPFMVDSARFERVRIVQDKSIEKDDVDTAEEGTKVLMDILDASDDTLFPLQGALGYEIYQTLFVGPNSLVVEGVSDLMYIQVISGILSRAGRIPLAGQWTITPVGGLDKVPTFVSLIGSQKGLNIATLLDIQKKDTQTIENLYKRRLLDRNKVLTYGDFVKRPEADVEDMFDVDFFLDLFSAEYKRELGGKKLTVADLDDHPDRIVVRLEKYMSANHSVGYNHFRPARHLSEHISALEAKIPTATLDRFEQAFAKLNDIIR